MRRFLIFAGLMAALGLVVAACGGGNGDETNGNGPTPTFSAGILPIPGNSELVVGPNRFSLGLIDENNEPIHQDSDTSLRFRFIAPDGTAQPEQDARFIWAIPDVTGLWAADVDFPEAGPWVLQVLLTRAVGETMVPHAFAVIQDSLVPSVGDAAPPTDNLTLGDEPNIKRLSTDMEPEPALYEMTVADALEAGQPFVVIFATPAFCQTAFCGPVVDNVKEVRQQFADTVNFIHIESFDLTADGRLVQGPQGPVASQPTLEWMLQTEPWTFIVGEDGIIDARFEGAASPGELAEAIERTLG